MQVALALAIVVIAIVLLSIERIPVEIASLAILVLLVLSGLATTEQALSGISSDTAVFIFVLLVLTRGLEATGAVQWLGQRVVGMARFGRGTFATIMLGSVCAMSAIASNTAVTAAFLPVVLASAKQLRLPPSKILLPVAFSAMLGGTITVFGSSTNLVVSAEMVNLGLSRIGVFELARLGVPIAVIGLAATLFLTSRLLPSRDGDKGEARLQRAYAAEAVVTPGSRFIGKDAAYAALSLGVPITALSRAGELLAVDAKTPLRAGDHLIVTGTRDEILRVKESAGVGLRVDLRHRTEDTTIAIGELVVMPTSRLVGQSVRAIQFARRHGVLILGIHRHPSLHARPASAPLRDVPLAAGDVLLVSGPLERVHDVAEDEALVVVGTVAHERPRYRRAALAVSIFAATIALAALHASSPAIVGLVGVLAMVATGCINPRTAFRVDWRIVVMIGTLIGLAQAIERSGAGEFLAQAVLPLGDVLGPRGVLLALMLATIVLSVPMSNQAAALVMLPVGFHTAVDMQVNPRTFAIGICLAASCSFLTPLEPSAALVYGPGHYRFSDFLRVGGPLTALVVAILILGVPLMWPFT